MWLICNLIFLQLLVCWLQTWRVSGCARVWITIVEKKKKMLFHNSFWKFVLQIKLYQLKVANKISRRKFEVRVKIDKRRWIECENMCHHTLRKFVRSKCDKISYRPNIQNLVQPICLTSRHKLTKCSCAKHGQKDPLPQENLKIYI